MTMLRALSVATDYHKAYRPDLLIASAADAPKSAPSPSSPVLPRECIGLFPLAGAVGSCVGERGYCAFRGCEPGRYLGLL